MVQRIVQFPNHKIKKIAQDVLQRNAFFAHQENVLLAMLANNDETVRHLAIKKIRSLRGQFSIENKTSESEAAPDQKRSSDGEGSVTSVSVRKFNVPAMNVHAESYHKLVNLNSDQTKEPPAIRHLANVYIKKSEKRSLLCITPAIIKLWSAT